jgi:hypothetical protein
MKKLALVVGVAAFFVSSVAVGHVAAEKVTAHLNAGQEVPKPVGTRIGASGTFTGTLNNGTLTWRLTFSHLSGPATAAHIHLGKKGVAGAVTLALCGPCKSGAHGSHVMTPPQLGALSRGGTYVNVHTAKNPGGEIRGQIKVVM